MRSKSTWTCFLDKHIFFFLDVNPSARFFSSRYLLAGRQSPRPPPRSPPNTPTGCPRCRRATLKEHAVACQSPRQQGELNPSPNPQLPTLVLLRSVVVVHWFPVPLSFAQFAGQVFLLLLIVVPQQLLPVIRIDVFLLFDDLPLDFLGLESQADFRLKNMVVYTSPLLHVMNY